MASHHDWFQALLILVNLAIDYWQDANKKKILLLCLLLRHMACREAQEAGVDTNYRNRLKGTTNLSFDAFIAP